MRNELSYFLRSNQNGRWVRPSSHPIPTPIRTAVHGCVSIVLRNARSKELAVVVTASVVALAGLGWLLDRWLATAPWLLVTGVVLGAVVGFYQFIRITSKLK